MQSALLAAIAARLSVTLGRRVMLRSAQPVGGGCIHRAYKVSGDEGDWFVKINDPGRADLFAAEADGLAALGLTPLRSPRVICRDVAAGQSFLALEWLTLGAGAPRDYAKLGEQLARLHEIRGTQFGWRRDNYIGATPQANASEDDWARFFGRSRLAPQLLLAKKSGHALLCSKGEALLEVLHVLLDAHAPTPSLLHGDLWGGNAAFLADGTPVIFDPAVYYGDREADLAMTELFGGFTGRFYAAYRAHAPLAAGYPVRRTLYNLYHVINHANLFGGAYAAQAAGMMDLLLSEVR